MLVDLSREASWSYVVTAESAESFRRTCVDEESYLFSRGCPSRGTGCRGRRAGLVRSRRTPHFQHSSWEAVRTFGQPRRAAVGVVLIRHGASDGGENGRFHASLRI